MGVKLYTYLLRCLFRATGSRRRQITGVVESMDCFVQVGVIIVIGSEDMNRLTANLNVI